MRYLILCFLLSSCASPPPAEGSYPPGPIYQAVAEGIVCNHCIAGIEKSLRQNPAVVAITIDMDLNIVRVVTRSDHPFDADTLRQALVDAGYSVLNVEQE